MTQFFPRFFMHPLCGCANWIFSRVALAIFSNVKIVFDLAQFIRYASGAIFVRKSDMNSHCHRTFRHQFLFTFIHSHFLHLWNKWSFKFMRVCHDYRHNTFGDQQPRDREHPAIEWWARSPCAGWAKTGIGLRRRRRWKMPARQKNSRNEYFCNISLAQRH